MFETSLTGVSAFPLTPLRRGDLDERAMVQLMSRLVTAHVDSIGVLGSTGVYPYLTREQRRRATRIAVAESGDIPVLAGIGHMATSGVLALAGDAQEAGVDAVLLAPVSYHPLHDDEVVALFEDVTRELSVPLVVYDNPGTTGVRFTLEMYARIATLPQVTAIKIPPIPLDLDRAREHVAAVRAVIPAHVRLGISGDAAGAMGLLAGCDLWFSALAGTLPAPVQAIAKAASVGDVEDAQRRSAQLQEIWDLFARYGGGIRVIAAIAEQLGLVDESVLPRPLLPLGADEQRDIADLLATLAPPAPSGAAGSALP